MKFPEYSTTRVDWRLRAEEVLMQAGISVTAAAVEYVADALMEAYARGGDGDCIHGDTCEECRDGEF